VRILCRYSNAFMQTFQCSCEKSVVFWCCTVVCLHMHGNVLVRWSAQLLVVNLVQKLSKLVNICKSYCTKFTGTFLWTSVVQRQIGRNLRCNITWKKCTVYIHIAPLGAHNNAICDYSAGHMTRFQPMLQHFWWWDNNKISSATSVKFTL